MDVSIIIINYNTLQLTQNCIDSIFAQKCDLKYEVILVDNASTDGSLEHFSKDDKIIYIYSNENLGFGKANNLGYQYASGKYIFLLNSDTILLNDALTLFFEEAERSNDNIGCFGSMLLNSKLEYIHSFAKFPTFGSILKKYANNYTRFLGFPSINEKELILSKYPAVVEYITGADLFIKRCVIEKKGLFNPIFFMYYEESEMQRRFLKGGFLSVIINSPQIIHLVGGSKTKKSLKRIRIELEGGFCYAKLCFPYIKYRLLRIFAFIILLPKIIIYPDSISEKMKTIKCILKK